MYFKFTSLLLIHYALYIYFLLKSTLFPKFQPQNIEHKDMIDHVNEMASRKGCTTAQLALAWVHYKGNDACPIPGTMKIKRP